MSGTFDASLRLQAGVAATKLTLTRWGVFRLTDPPGLKAILDCSQPGIFHPHAEANMYTDASRPGHVCELAGLDFELVDLRPGKG